VRALVQRVTRASVHVQGELKGEIGAGLLVLVGATHGDDDEAVQWLARKVSELRIFGDEQGRMNLDVREAGGAVLVVPQFTLYGDARRGRRPDFMSAARPELAAPLVESFGQALERLGLLVARGVFGAHMVVELVNDGPVTLMIESPRASESA
jgi:D-tyrosyl-tRNA(Tyr) deacylase